MHNDIISSIFKKVSADYNSDLISETNACSNKQGTDGSTDGKLRFFRYHYVIQPGEPGNGPRQKVELLSKYRSIDNSTIDLLTDKPSETVL